MFLGLCGLARSGKDSFYRIVDGLSTEGVARYAFADELKKECYNFVMRNTEISVFSEDPDVKKLIRPLLVAYGTNLRRAINPDCWIMRLEPKVLFDLRKNINVCITDIRYENEIDWLHKHGGTSVYIEKEGNSFPNNEEKINDPVLREKSKLFFKWSPDDHKLDATKNKIKNFLEKNKVFI